MQNEQKITCIVCPIGCKIIIITDGKEIKKLDGSKCKRGVEYAKNEALDPRRMLTTSIRVIDGDWPLICVKSDKPIPKNKLFKVLDEIKRKSITAPVENGEIIINNIANTGINICATKTVKKI